MSQITYANSGVDLELYQKSMQKLPALMRRTHSSRVMDLPGGFAGLFRLDYNSKLFSRNYRDPVLVSGTDGVGTKLKVAVETGVYNTVGIDLVAMCVNDCLCLGAEPLFFLDYLAMGKDDPEMVGQLVEGVSQGCLDSGAALLGGETAIMPGIYSPGDFDMAGFCVGVVERKRLIDGRAIRPGNVVIGLASAGLHSNGYSLVRKAVFEHAGLAADEFVPELEQTVGEALLTPTRIYAQLINELMEHYKNRMVIRGMAHITGGGLAENIERILPENCGVKLRRDSWEMPAVFPWMQNLANIDTDEMFRVFNMGIGYVIIANPYFADSIQRQARDRHVDSWIIGEVCEGNKSVEWAD